MNIRTVGLLFVWLLIATALCSCSMVQWLPSSACEYVKYERIGNKATVAAECAV